MRFTLWSWQAGLPQVKATLPKSDTTTKLTLDRTARITSKPVTISATRIPTETSTETVLIFTLLLLLVSGAQYQTKVLERPRDQQSAYPRNEQYQEQLQRRGVSIARLDRNQPRVEMAPLEQNYSKRRVYRDDGDLRVETRYLERREVGNAGPTTPRGKNYQDFRREDQTYQRLPDQRRGLNQQRGFFNEKSFNGQDPRFTGSARGRPQQNRPILKGGERYSERKPKRPQVHEHTENKKEYVDTNFQPKLLNDSFSKNDYRESSSRGQSLNHLTRDENFNTQNHQAEYAH